MLDASRAPHYYVTAADHKYIEHIKHLIGSIFKYNVDSVAAIGIFDLGMTEEQRAYLSTIKHVELLTIPLTNPGILTPMCTYRSGNWEKMVPGSYAFKPVALKTALDRYPYVLWLDAATTVKQNLDDLFYHITSQGSFICTSGDTLRDDGTFRHSVESEITQYVRINFRLDDEAHRSILSRETVMSGIIGIRRDSAAYQHLVLPLYQYTYDVRYFIDDGTGPGGFGTARHDQAMVGVLTYLAGLPVFKQDSHQRQPMIIQGVHGPQPLFITWRREAVDERTSLYSSRGDYSHCVDAPSYVQHKN